MAYEYDRVERENGGGAFLMGMLAGTVLGAGLGMLFAPKAGSEVRKQLSEQASRLRSTANDTMHQASEKLSQVSQQASDKIGQVSQQASDKIGQASEKVTQIVDRGREVVDRGREAYDRAKAPLAERPPEAEATECAARTATETTGARAAPAVAACSPGRRARPRARQAALPATTSACAGETARARPAPE